MAAVEVDTPGYVNGYRDLVRLDVNDEIVQKSDLKTPDNHVGRDERMIRLTGTHPFNSEAPLTTLYEAGFLTPAGLHYVRNHGAVPKVMDDEVDSWTIEISGMCDNPTTISFQDLRTKFEVNTLPVTLVCAGNRRMEQNMVRKGSGFNWGAAGCSTSLWTGVYLFHLMDLVKPHRKAKFVHFEGADALPNGAYGTCVRMDWAKSFERAFMITWLQNGKPLTPDHGRPVRVLLPGIIGGRSVKWLKKITISDVPSENFYHIYDNRVLPTIVTPEMARAEKKWWADERYAIYDLNVQSAIVYPEHQFRLSKSLDHESTYTAKGYAYNGGGIRIGRVELSLDRGKSWRLASIRYPEDEYRELGITELFGGQLDLEDRQTSYCWCFWEADFTVGELIKAKDIVVRAMDESMNCQPRDMYWSVMSMLNNWWFRVAIVDEGDSIMFEHPTKLHEQTGWMDRVKAKGGNIVSTTWGEDDVPAEDSTMLTQPATVTICMTREDALKRKITKAEYEENVKAGKPWFVVEGQVYDGEPFLDEHPGGADSITMVAGEDATEDFMAIHSETAKNMLATYHLGTLVVEDANGSGAEPAEAETPKATFLEPKKWKKVKLAKRTDLSHDTRLFEFELETPEQVSGLGVGQHVFIRLPDSKGQLVMRAYTPYSDGRTKGILSLLVKVYFPSGEIPGGKMTTLLEAMKVGDTLEVKGPTGSFLYESGKEVTYKGQVLPTDVLFMVGGGSGITPHFQVLRELAEKAGGPAAHLLFGNKEERDIMCRDHLDLIVNDTLKVDYYLSSATTPLGWDHKCGRVTADDLDALVNHANYTGMKSMVLVCGPDGMVESVKQWVEKTGYDKSRFVIF